MTLIPAFEHSQGAVDQECCLLTQLVFVVPGALVPPIEDAVGRGGRGPIYFYFFPSLACQTEVRDATALISIKIQGLRIRRSLGDLYLETLYRLNFREVEVEVLQQKFKLHFRNTAQHNSI